MTKPTDRCEIAAADRDALTVQVNGHHWEVPWSDVTMIAVGRGLADKTGDTTLLVVATGVVIEGEERVFVVVEGEAIWVSFTEIIPEALPGIPPFEVWGVKALTANGPLILYQPSEGTA